MLLDQSHHQSAICIGFSLYAVKLSLFYSKYTYLLYVYDTFKSVQKTSNFFYIIFFLLQSHSKCLLFNCVPINTYFADLFVGTKYFYFVLACLPLDEACTYVGVCMIAARGVEWAADAAAIIGVTALPTDP